MDWVRLLLETVGGPLRGVCVCGCGSFRLQPSQIHHHSHNITLSPSLSHDHTHTITLTTSPSHHHPHTITLTTSHSPHHSHTIILTPSLSHHHSHTITLPHIITLTSSPSHHHTHTITLTKRFPAMKIMYPAQTPRLHPSTEMSTAHFPTCPSAWRPSSV